MRKANQRRRVGRTESRHAAVIDKPGESQPRITRGEWLLVITLLLVGVGVRFAFPARMAVEHFDEGVYASNIWFGAEFGYQYPQRRLYAPPLLPSLIESSIIGASVLSPSQIHPSSLVVMAPSLLAGCLTLVAVWWIAREWFGAAVAVPALALAALSDLHCLYSRAALTDALLVLFVLLAVWGMQRAVVRCSLEAIVTTGVCTGLAWWTKYNGWLPLAIGLAGIGLAMVVGRHQRINLLRAGGCWLVIAALAFALWSPYLWQLQAPGGYAAIAANHAKYVVGLSGWGSSLQQQYASLCHDDSWLSCAGIGLAVMLSAVCSGWSCDESSRRCRVTAMVALALGMAAAAAWLGSALVLFALALCFIGRRLWQTWRREMPDAARTQFALYLIAVWIIGLFVATPFYYPYPRLTLPWICGLWLAAAAGLHEVAETKAFQKRAAVFGKQTAVAAVVLALALIVGAVASGRITAQPVAWQSRAEFEPIAAKIVNEVQQRAVAKRNDAREAIVFVYGEPALFFHLNAVGSQAFIPAGNLEFVEAIQAGVPMFLVAGPHAERTPSYVEAFSQRRARLALIDSYDFTPSDLVLLNEFHPRDLQDRRKTIQTIRLYEVVAADWSN